ncbi:MAG: LysR family transcriptional regulator, partial [Alphaproteobacteria bacterium]
HHQIKGLEAAVGAPCLAKGAGGRLELTGAGTEMLRAAERVQGILSQAERQLAARRRGRLGHVTIAAGTTAMYFVPEMVRRLREELPEVEIDLRFGNRAQVIDDVDRGRCALAIMGRPPRRPEVEAAPLGRHPHGIIVPPGHPLAAGRGFDPEALIEEPILARERGSGTRLLLERYLERLELARQVTMIELDSNEAIKQGVIARLGIAFLSLHTVAREVADGHLVVARGPLLPVMRQWYLVRPRAFAPDPAALAVAEAIRGMNGAFLPRVPLDGPNA